jgi:GNS1/SUR4 family
MIRKPSMQYFFQIIFIGFGYQSLFNCETDKEKNYAIEVVAHYCLNLKLFALIESVFMVLRKKTNQLSHMHLFHQVSTVVVYWIMLRYSPGMMKMFLIFTDKTGDVVRFVYYLLSCFTNHTRVFTLLKQAKPVIIILQLVQLVLVSGHAIYAVTKKCEVSNMFYLVILHTVVLFGLYLNYYRQNFLKKKTHKK